MNTFDYQRKTPSTAVYHDSINEVMAEVENYPATLHKFLAASYCAGKLNGEAGEVAEEVFKALRDDAGQFSEERLRSLMKEIGDVMWYVSQLCNELELSLSDILDLNIAKLEARKEMETLHGKGSDR